MSSFESLVGAALLGGDRSVSLCRLAVKSAVVSRITCRCGAVLDQQTAALLHIGPISGDGPAVAVLCPACLEACGEECLITASDRARADHGAGLFVVDWSGQREIG
jgi:hypothetical protein